MIMYPLNLGKHFDKIPMNTDCTPIIPLHLNIRGAANYQCFSLSKINSMNTEQTLYQMRSLKLNGIASAYQTLLSLSYDRSGGPSTSVN